MNNKEASPAKQVTVTRRQVLLGMTFAAADSVLNSACGLENPTSTARDLKTTKTKTPESIIRGTTVPGSPVVEIPEGRIATPPPETTQTREARIPGRVLDNAFFDAVRERIATTGGGEVDPNSTVGYAFEVWGRPFDLSNRIGFLKLATSEALRHKKQGAIKLAELFSELSGTEYENTAFWADQMPKDSQELTLPQKDGKLEPDANVFIWSTGADENGAQKTLIGYTHHKGGKPHLRFALIPTFSGANRTEATLQSISNRLNLGFKPTPSNVELINQTQGTTTIWGTNVHTLELLHQLQQEIWRDKLATVKPGDVIATLKQGGEIVLGKTSRSHKRTIDISNIKPGSIINSPITGRITMAFKAFRPGMPVDAYGIVIKTSDGEEFWIEYALDAQRLTSGSIITAGKPILKVGEKNLPPDVSPGVRAPGAKVSIIIPNSVALDTVLPDNPESLVISP